MIISEKQILQLIRVADSYCCSLHRLGQYKDVEQIQYLLAEINDQQPNELKEIN